MKLARITFVLLAALLLGACQEEVPEIPGGGNTPEEPEVPVEPVDPVEPVELINQYAINDEVSAIGSVVKYDLEGQLVFALYEEADIVETSEDIIPALEIRIAPASLSKTLDLAAITAEEAVVTAKEVNIGALTGTLEVTLLEEKVTIKLESTCDEKVQLRAHYDGAFATQETQAPLDNQYAINDDIKTIGSVVKYTYESWYILALYEQEGITEPLTDISPAIEIYIAPTSLGKTLDLATITTDEAAILVSNSNIATNSLTGSLTVILDENQQVATIQLESKTTDETSLRAQYCGNYTNYIELQNQFLIGDAIPANVFPIGQVYMIEDESNYQFYILHKDKNSRQATDTIFVITIEPSAMGQELDLATTNQASVSCKWADVAQLSGTINVKFGRTNETVEITLDAINSQGHHLCANYSGLYGIKYVAKNPHFTVTSQEGMTTEYGAIATLLRKAEGGTTNFAFADNGATTAAGCTSAQVGVWFALAPYQGEVDATQIASFTFIDYTNNKVYDSTTSNIESGIITTKIDSDGYVYIAMDVTLNNDINISAEYYGTPIDVDDLTPMLPAKESGFYYYDGSGKLTASAIINKVTCKTNTKGQLEFKFGTTDTNSTTYTWPELTISPDFVNAGTIDCSNLPLNSFKLKYQSFQMESASGNEYKDPYIHVPTNGTLSVSKDDAGNYTISFDMIDEYTKGPIEKPNDEDIMGSKYRLVITYQGAVIEQ